MINIINLDFVRGDTVPFHLEFEDDNGPIDISGWIISLTIKTDELDPDVSAVFQTDVTMPPSSTNGLAYIEAPASATKDLLGNYFYDVQYKTDEGVTQTIIKGLAKFVRDITIRGS